MVLGYTAVKNKEERRKEREPLPQIQWCESVCFMDEFIFTDFSVWPISDARGFWSSSDFLHLVRVSPGPLMSLTKALVHSVLWWSHIPLYRHTTASRSICLLRTLRVLLFFSLCFFADVISAAGNVGVHVGLHCKFPAPQPVEVQEWAGWIMRSLVLVI